MFAIPIGLIVAYVLYHKAKIAHFEKNWLWMGVYTLLMFMFLGLVVASALSPRF